MSSINTAQVDCTRILVAASVIFDGCPETAETIQPMLFNFLPFEFMNFRKVHFARVTIALVPLFVLPSPENLPYPKITWGGKEIGFHPT